MEHGYFLTIFSKNGTKYYQFWQVGLFAQHTGWRNENKVMAKKQFSCSHFKLYDRMCAFFSMIDAAQNLKI